MNRKKSKININRLVKLLASIALSTVLVLELMPLGPAFNINTAYAASSDLLYEEKEQQTITSGVTYEKSQRLYKGGWIDIYTLTVDMQNSNVGIDVLESVTEYGLKKSVENLAKENGAVAAVNADFFSSGNPRSSMGQVVENGESKAVQNYYNGSENKYAGIFIGNDNVPFIDYLKSTIGFYNSAQALIELQAKNKITDFSKPVYFDRKVITSTADIDKRRSGLYKIVVDNGTITKISGEGEVVDVPENGYIIVMNKATASEKLAHYSVGQTVSFNESETFLFRPQKPISEVSLAISGGGELVRNGKAITQGLIIGANSRNPRTCIGVDKDKTKLIIMAIDGRGVSIGTTHIETANLMIEYGAYDAIHFDGGGSTTMVVRNEGDTALSVANNPSEGSQRSVANAFGLKSNNAAGELAELMPYIENHEDGLIMNKVGVDINVLGFDAYYNPTTVDTSKLTFEHTGVLGEWSANRFYPQEEGDAVITVRSGENVVGSAMFKVISEPSSMIAGANSKSLVAGESTYLTVSLLNKDGYESEVDFREIAWSVDNPSVGYVEGGKFFAAGDGVVNLTASYNGVNAMLSIVVGKTAKYITSFEETRQLYMMYYPEDFDITGGSGVTGAYSASGEKSLMLSYKFAPNSTQTQAAYVCFDKQPLALEGAPTDIGMWVKGDKSGNLLKMVLKDKNGKQYLLPIIDGMNSDEWQYVSIPIPAGVSYPVSIDKIYAAALETTDAQTGVVYIDNISQLSPLQSTAGSVSTFTDFMRTDLSGAPVSGEEDITVFGQTSAKTEGVSDTVLNTAMQNMSANARAMVFAGPSAVNNTTGVPSVIWDNKYYTTNTTNTSIINLATGKGSLRQSNPDQWRWLQGYLRDFSKNNIIINMDRDIWSSSYSLSDSRENEIFHKILKEFTAETGKNVIVVSACGYNTGVKVKEGVRYITLNGLSAYNPSDMSSYKYLRIRAGADYLYYDIRNLYG